MVSERTDFFTCTITVEKWLFLDFPRYSGYSIQVRWTGVKDVDVKFSQDLKRQKSLKSVNFWQSYLKNKKVDVFFLVYSVVVVIVASNCLTAGVCIQSWCLTCDKFLVLPLAYGDVFNSSMRCWCWNCVVDARRSKTCYRCLEWRVYTLAWAEFQFWDNSSGILCI